MKISAEMVGIAGLGFVFVFGFGFVFVFVGMEGEAAREEEEEKEESEERKVSNVSKSGVVLNGGTCRVLYCGKGKMVV